MGKSKETAPAPPNAQGLANTQFQANRDAAIESALLNQLDQSTPFGDMTYTGEIGTPDRTVTTALTPEGQAILGLAAQQAAMGQQARQYSLESEAYNQARNDMIAERAQPLNELAALSSGQQFQYPQFQSGGGVNLNPAPIADMEYANYQAALDAYNQNQTYDAINRRGLYDLLGTGAMAYGMMA